jgi:hypothetical protein
MLEPYQLAMAGDVALWHTNPAVLAVSAFIFSDRRMDDVRAAFITY